MSMSVRSLSVFAGAALVAASACVTTANAQVLLTVDTTNPNAIVFASTGAAAAVSDTRSPGSFRLDNILLTGGIDFGATLTSNTLRAAVSGTTYFNVGRLFGGTSLRFAVPAGSTQIFTAGQTAFSGSVTTTDPWGGLKPVGTIGNIVIVGSPNSFDTGIVIGQYRIVPAPTTAAAAGLLALTATARRRRR